MSIFDFLLSPEKLYKKHFDKIVFEKKEKYEMPQSPRMRFLSLFRGETKSLMSTALMKNISNGGALSEWIDWLMSFSGVEAKIKPDTWNIIYTFHAEGSHLMTVTYRRTPKDFLIERKGYRAQIHIADIE